MKFHRISLDFLIFFQELLSINFDEKSALNHIQNIHRPFKPQCAYINSQLNQGLSFYEILSNNNFKPWAINCTITTFNLTRWLSYKINYFKETQSFIDQIKKILVGPILLLGFSVCLNLYLIFIFMPKILLLLSEFNNVIPKWILYLESSIIFFKTHGLLLVVVIVGSCAIFRSFIFNIYTKIISNVYQQLFVVDLFSVITPLLHEKIGLKNIIKHISITKSPILNTTFSTFKDSIIKSDPYEKSFSYLIKNQAFVQIIIQSIATNNLEFGLEKVALFYRKYHKTKVVRIAVSLKLTAFIIIGFNILIGFYLTLLPMNQIISKLIS